VNGLFDIFLPSFGVVPTYIFDGISLTPSHFVAFVEFAWLYSHVLVVVAAYLFV